MDVFGPTGPIEDFAKALDAAPDPKSRPRLALEVRRGDRTLTPTLALPRRSETFGADFPFDDRSAALLERLRDHLAEQQRDDGSFGNPVHDTFAPLALLGSKKAAHRKAALKNARYHARTTSREDDRWLVNWHYTSAALVLSEVHLSTGDRKLLPELEEIRDFLLGTQYLDLSQVNPKVKESHPDSYPKNGDQQHGGWGHNPGFEGYGPIAMITGQAALGLAMIERCGIDVPDDRQRAAYAFLKRGSGSNGYLWYGDSAAGDRNWADMGRTGASAIAHWMSPHREHRPGATARRSCPNTPRASPTPTALRSWGWASAPSARASTPSVSPRCSARTGGGSCSRSVPTGPSTTSPIATTPVTAPTRGSSRPP